MNARTQITMDPEMQRRAHAKAAELGISFAEYVRRVIAQDLGEAKPKADISMIFDLVDEGPRTNIARDKDKFLGEAVWQEYLRKTGHKPRRRQQVSVFVDSSVWFAAPISRDQHNDRREGGSCAIARSIDERSRRGRDVAPPEQPGQPRRRPRLSGAGCGNGIARSNSDAQLTMRRHGQLGSDSRTRLSRSSTERALP